MPVGDHAPTTSRSRGRAEEHHFHTGRFMRNTVICEALELRRLMATGPIISEFVASNSTGIVDADGEHSDWLEIYNPTAAPVDMTGWRLTDTAANPALWTFPAMTLAAGERRVIF